MALSNLFDRDASINDVTAAVHRDGYAVVQNLLDDGQLSKLTAELEPHLEQTAFGDEDFWGHHTKRFGALIAKSETARDMVIQPTVLGVADQLLLDHAASYWLNYTGVMYLAPGERAQALHRDTNLWPFANPAPPATLATMWAVNDFTQENGGTLVVPGSHRWEDARKPQPHEIEATAMPAGSVLLYTGNVIHGGGANRAAVPRYGVALHYVLGWLRQEENQLLTMSREEARQLPEAIQRLMGYSLGASALGMIDHRDPYEYLTGIREDKPRALSSPQLDANEARMTRLKLTPGDRHPRIRYDVDA